MKKEEEGWRGEGEEEGQHPAWLRNNVLGLEEERNDRIEEEEESGEVEEEEEEEKRGRIGGKERSRCYNVLSLPFWSTSTQA